MSAPTPVFEAPWHAQLFAMTVYLNEAGRFGWPEWAQRFGETLKRHGVERELDGGDDYFMAWLETLEGYLSQENIALSEEIVEIKGAWERAYLSTPHGKPVRL